VGNQKTEESGIMKKSKMVVLGIDGMDFDYTRSILHKLPNIKKLSETGLVAPFKSVFPPDSIPSWITAYTGKDPSEHGILESIDYFAKGDVRVQVDTSVFKGFTFWDYLGKENVDVCIINPFMAYPVWPVNGLMVNGPVFISGEIQLSNPELVQGVPVPKSLGGITDFPNKKNLGEFCDKIFKDTKEQMDFGIALFERNRPRFFFQTFLTMDRIQHFLWRYCDKNDPTYPGKNIYEKMIEDFYVYTDKIIGKFFDVIDSDTRLVIISDHGHGMRCTHCFNLNEYFRRKGYLLSSAGGKFINKRLIIEKMKNWLLQFLNKHDLEDYIQVIAQFVPNAKELKKGKHITDNSKNKVYVSDFTGTNPFGGICLNKTLIDNYEEFRKTLAKELGAIEYDGKPVFNWIKYREDLFNGEFIERFPDILFEMNPCLGINWNLHTDLFTVNPTHKKISGGHKEYGVLFTNKITAEHINLNRLNMVNLFPTLLDYFGIEYRDKCKGNSFFE
jgi:predicted AlkP superfamily phosphohydrolase/phosphomutase